MKRPGYALVVVLDVVLLIGLVQGWLPTSSDGFRKFLIAFTSVILGFIVYLAIRPARRD
ncbi:hypothetical protein Shyhy01_76280 [Streptomyces hygroscopicus subsp. hygroscopicus]|uniref:hypothetical protein n=1 Tax=Streptomyces sp. KHY 26 TaxID=3097359 RepID=UPI0024A02C3B|nr:hypothetical protein [Streptomyces hygroscopicus]GLX54679.1 hypothetical protein Shyhy01_76280 [Streptomyces hygroscopicus subsp. hygroscopicus]